MKSTTFLMVFVLAVVTTASTLADKYTGKMGDFISAPAIVEARIVVLGLDPEVRALAERVRSNMSKNSEWLQTYVRELHPGQEAPYHQNFGVSEAEYQLLVKGIRGLNLVPVGSATLTFEYRDDDTLQISGLPGEAPFDQIIYEPVSDSILCSYGTLTKSEQTAGRLSASEETGWTGRIWKLRRTEDNDNANIGFVLGRFDKSGQNILIHEVKGRVDDQPIDYHYMLVWDVPSR
ncbi:MAG: hypothetical protein HKN70_14095 [Gammaproteobacteria bacterium]|nr:hypothetical protein [Gammaproteobacteria bacterium]